MQDAVLYTTSNQMQRRDTASVLASVLPHLTWKKDETILDLGSGAGDVTMSLLSQNIPVKHRLLGLDTSPNMVDFANQSYGSDDVTFHCLDISKVDNPRVYFPGGFNKVFSFYCLHWIKDIETTMKNVESLLKDGGDAVFLFIASNPIFNMYRLIAENPRWAPYMKDCERYIPVYQDSFRPAEDFRCVLERTGLNVVMCEAKEHSYTFSNQTSFLRAFKAINPFIHRIPKAEEREYINDCLATLTSLEVPVENGRIVARYKLLMAHVKKYKTRKCSY